MQEISEKYVPFFRNQLKIMTNSDLTNMQAERIAQDSIGKLVQFTVKGNISCENIEFPGFSSAMFTPDETDVDGILMYVHGGGYCCGDLNYAKGYGKFLCSELNVKVFCIAYRLAPENKFPAGLNDCMQAYRYLLEKYDSKKIVLAGESAGGGMIFAMCCRMKDEGLPIPAGLVAISPWTDLTQSGDSYNFNDGIDPSMTPGKLAMFAENYTEKDNFANPYVSPICGDLTGFPDSLLFVGGDEVMLDDTVLINQALLGCGCKSEMIIADGFWHAYVFYNFKERRCDIEKISDFVREKLS